MEMIQGLSFIVALLLMPFLCRGKHLAVKMIYLTCMTLLTPLIGYPLYRYLSTH